MSQDEKHLSAEEIELLRARQVDHRADYSQSEVNDRGRRHLAMCEDCQKLISMHEKWDRVLQAMRDKNPLEAAADCPPKAVLFELAAGILIGHDEERLIVHIAGCDRCGLELRNAYEVLSDNVTPEEHLQIDCLKSTQPAWQEKLVKRLMVLSGTSHENGSTNRARESVTRSGHELESDSPHSAISAWWRDPSFGSRVAASGISFAVLILIIAATWFGFRSMPTPDVNHLLAEAYSENRLLELRIPNAKYAPVSSSRGEVSEPQALKDANSLIGHRLLSNPDDPMWLDAKGRAELIALHYDAAIDTLSRAADLQLDSVPIMIDLASAYYLRAKANNDRQIDYATAVEKLGRALAKSPDDPIALFNRAISNDALNLYEPAIDDWQHYLRIDPSGDWANEARSKLDAVQKKVRTKRSSLENPLLAPAKLLTTKTNTAELEQEIDERIEDYLQLSTKEWLPQVFPVTRQGNTDRNVRQILTVLARVARDRHDDPWLSELLNQPHGLDFNPAVARLASAVKANESGDYAGGRKAAHEARMLFRSADSIAGELRAQADEVYSHHLLYEGPTCMHLDRDLIRRLRSHGYRWLRAQAFLEAANCDYLAGNFGAARIALERGTIEAKDANYIGLYLRGLGFQADSAASVGDPKAGFSLASYGLDLFWSGQADLMKGYNLYTDLDTAADGLRFPNLQMGIWRQATSLIDLHPDTVQRAMAHRWYGNSAYLANRSDIAEREFATASRLFRESPQTEATARGQMDAEIWLAGLEARKGDLGAADARLERVREGLAAAPSFATEIGFYTAQADVSLRKNNPRATEQSLQSAVFLAEWGLSSFTSPDDRRLWTNQTDRTYRTLVWWKLHQGNPEAALELWEWYKGAEYRIPKGQTASISRLNTAAPPDPRQAPPIAIPRTVVDRLPWLRGKSVITYALFSDGLAAWLYDDRGIFFHWIPSAGLLGLVTRFEHLCSTRGSNLPALRSTAHSLYDLLIGPLEGNIEEGRTLAFELDGALSGIPLEALVDRANRYLVERGPLVVTPGLYQTLHLHSESPITAKSRALVVSVPVTPDRGFAPLLDAETEAGNVAGSFKTPKWLRGTSATLGMVRRDLRDADVFHFAGHAVALPERSGLLLAERDPQTQRAVLIGPGSLSPNRIQRLQLAVLSACDTWPAAESVMYGTEDLTKSLLRAGVPHVLASRWRVDSNETAELMRQFYEKLLLGNDIPTSLRAAQLKLASESASAHPYYWAAFGDQGKF